ncbi:MAG: bifunctional 4-hydroxy-2-oxoglutarate aldolase/2-dehydro-3-deoxy-phosphogluconate aldolase [Spirochaetes bacterium]|nr:bifunctional 4-hydroxy-2-oxoglutarate aldolase/2-dehydro-3-deoxy-phosphogluconate aldolase [Spirochaetota bacterium]
MKDIYDVFEQCKIVPVVVIEKVEHALKLAELLSEEKLPVMEITFRTNTASQAIKEVKDTFSCMTVGAGTLITTRMIDQAIESGAEFFVAPGFNPRSIEHALKQGIKLIPGVTNPSLIEQALNYELTMLKFFPAENSGKTGMLKTFNTVYRDVKFLPTGGINPGNIMDYLSLPNVTACGGSWLVNAGLVKEEKWDTLRLLIRNAVSLVKDYKSSR